MAVLLMLDRLSLLAGILLFSFQSILLGNFSYPIPEFVISFLFLPRLTPLLLLFPFVENYFFMNLYFGVAFVYGLFSTRVFSLNRVHILVLKLVIVFMLFISILQVLGFTFCVGDLTPSPLNGLNRCQLFFVEPSLVGPWAVLMFSLIRRGNQASLLSRKSYHIFFLSLIVISLSSFGFTGFLSVFIILIFHFGFRLKYIGPFFFGFIALLVSRVSDHTSVSALFTTGISSWRNVPDLAIIYNWHEYLWPQLNQDVKSKLGNIIDSQFEMNWLNNTFNLFSAISVTTGLISLFVFFLLALKYRLKVIRPVYLLFFLLIVPKYLAFIYFYFNSVLNEKIRDNIPVVEEKGMV